MGKKEKKSRKPFSEKNKHKFPEPLLKKLEEAGLDTKNLIFCCSGDMDNDACYRNAWISFDEKGQIIIDKEECDMDADELMMIAIDAGADDFVEEEDSYEIITEPDAFSGVFAALEEAKIATVSAEVTMIPQTWGTLTDEGDIKSMNKILDLLDEDDDVQEVYHNWDE